MTDDLFFSEPPAPTDEDPASARILVAYAGGAVSFDLSGTELSEIAQADGSTHRYLGNASRDHIGEQVENGLLHLAHGHHAPAGLTGVPEGPLRDAATGANVLTEAIDLLLNSPVMAGGTEHGLDAHHDGDGWNEPFSAHYSCFCGDWSGFSWTQTDPEQTGRPDTTEVALAWRLHVLTYPAQQRESRARTSHPTEETDR